MYLTDMPDIGLILVMIIYWKATLYLMHENIRKFPKNCY